VSRGGNRRKRVPTCKGDEDSRVLDATVAARVARGARRRETARLEA